MTWALSSTQKLTAQPGAEQDQLNLLPSLPWVDGDRGVSLLPTCTFPVKSAATQVTSGLQLY